MDDSSFSRAPEEHINASKHHVLFLFQTVTGFSRILKQPFA